jgi:hypothetical protein
MRRVYERHAHRSSLTCPIDVICLFAICCLPNRSLAKESASQRLSRDGSCELIVHSFGTYPAAEIDLRLDHV